MAPCSTNASLDGMEHAPCGQALDGDHLPPVGLVGQHQAGVDRLAVEQHRAGAALPGAAAVLGAGEADIVADDLQQGAAACRPGGDTHRRSPLCAALASPSSLPSLPRRERAVRALLVRTSTSVVRYSAEARTSLMGQGLCGGLRRRRARSGASSSLCPSSHLLGLPRPDGRGGNGPESQPDVARRPSSPGRRRRKTRHAHRAAVHGGAEGLVVLREAARRRRRDARWP